MRRLLAIAILFGAYAHANTFAPPFAVRAYPHGVAVYSGAQIYTCSVPLAANTYAGQGFSIAQACGADRVFSARFERLIP